MADYYHALGVSREATSDEINRAFKRWARSNHPDMGGDEALFKEMSVGRDQLLNPETRAQYDAGLPAEEPPVDVVPAESQTEIPELAGLNELLSRIESLSIPEKQDRDLFIEVYGLGEKMDDKQYALRRYADTLFEKKYNAAKLASDRRQYELRQQIYRAQKENPNAVRELEKRLMDIMAADNTIMKQLDDTIQEQLRPLRERMKQASLRLKEIHRIAKGPEPVREAPVPTEPPKERSFWEKVMGKRR